MNEINIGKNIIKFRRSKGITQDELASYIGVSKSSVSKWENSITYPDIMLLPQLATLFNISLDELMGYEPQLIKEDIQKIYFELAQEFAQNDSNEVLKKCEEYIKKYYSCFEFLKQMVVLYLNHHMLFENKDEILNRARELCIRIREESDNPQLIKEAISLESLSLIMANKPSEVLEILGEDVKVFSQDAELISMSFQLLGNINKASEITQICMYQHLIGMVGNIAQQIMLNINNLDVVEECFKRGLGICELFKLDEIHPNVAVNLYLATAQAYATHKQNEKALELIQKYTDVCIKHIYNFELRGDKFFDKIDKWLEELDLGVNAPRSQKLIKQSATSAIKDNPAFVGLKDEYKFKSCVLALESN
nr:helix-turn-helix transcriptional regulator [uncultured Intestinibacter sp.]